MADNAEDANRTPTRHEAAGPTSPGASPIPSHDLHSTPTQAHGSMRPEIDIL